MAILNRDIPNHKSVMLINDLINGFCVSLPLAMLDGDIPTLKLAMLINDLISGCVSLTLKQYMVYRRKKTDLVPNQI